jgi:hypothetical protein
MGKAAVALLVNQIENMAVYPEELLFEPNSSSAAQRGAPARGRWLALYLPFARNPH